MNRFAFVVLFNILLTLKTYGQLKLTGKVLDAHNSPIELATIKLDGLNRIAMSNDSGYFSMHLPANVKKGDVLTVHVSKDNYADAIRRITVSDSAVLIIMGSNSPEQAVRPVVRKINSDTSYLQNKTLAIRQTDTVNARSFNQDNLRDVFYSLSSDKNKPISIECIKDDREALHFATQLHDILIQSGYKNISEVALVTFPHPIKGQFINRNTSGVKITIGHKP